MLLRSGDDLVERGMCQKAADGGVEVLVYDPGVEEDSFLVADGVEGGNCGDNFALVELGGVSALWRKYGGEEGVGRGGYVDDGCAGCGGCRGLD